MAKAKLRVVYYAIARRILDELPSEVALDMLRYDGARVEEQCSGFWILSIEAEGRIPCPNENRWRSFGIAIADSAEEISVLRYRLKQALITAGVHP